MTSDAVGQAKTYDRDASRHAVYLDKLVRVGVAALVRNNETLLMLQRYGKHGSGSWSLPGGWMDFGETFQQAAEREVLEETGIRIEAGEIGGLVSTVFREDFIHCVTVVVNCTYIDGEIEIREPDKCTAMEWVPLRQVRDKQPLFEPLRQWIADYGLVPGWGML